MTNPIEQLKEVVGHLEKSIKGDSQGLDYESLPHVRSISEPSASHPLVATVEEEIKKLKAWKAPSASPSFPDSRAALQWLARLKVLYDCTEDLLQLPLVLL
ncbi:hypothetical protein ACLOJK_017588 [Asimina triloba]